MGADYLVCDACHDVRLENKKETYRCYICNEIMRHTRRNEVINGRLYNASFPYEQKEITIPDGVEILDIKFWPDNMKIEKVILPKSIKCISWHCFESCGALETVEMPDGLQEIGGAAFKFCKGLRYVFLPSSLKKIGPSAFEPDAHTEAAKVIALPKNLSEIGENAFGWNHELKNTLFLVAKGSYAEQYVKTNGFQFLYYDGNDGFLTKEVVHNGVLYCGDNRQNKILSVKSGIKSIGPCVFSGHTEIEEVVLPNSLEEIQSYAFCGCTSITHLKCNDRLKKIGEKAFYDADLCYAELPESIEEIAPDAFRESCVVAIGGEMPGYAAELDNITAKQAEISKEEIKLENLIKEYNEQNNKVQAHTQMLPEGYNEILDCRKYKDKCILLNEKKICDVVQTGNATDVLSFIQAEVVRLFNERNSCFFLSVSKKKEIDERIAELKQYESVLLQWLNEEQEMKKKSDALSSRIEKFKCEIEETEKELKNKTDALDNAHKAWKERFAKAKIRQNECVLAHEQQKLISEMNMPAKQEVKISFRYKNPLIEEKLLNEIYVDVYKNYVERQYALQYNKTIENHQKEIARIKEIDELLSKESSDCFTSIKEPEKMSDFLPDRFVKLNKFFASNRYWASLKECAKDVFLQKDSKNSFFNTFFAGMEYFYIAYYDRYFFFFPYCLVDYTEGKQLRVYTYDKVSVKTSYIDKEETVEEVPENGELIGSRYVHVNIDGTPSRRYKDNPLIKTFRYTNVTLVCNNVTVCNISVPSYNKAVILSEEYSRFAEELLKGSKKDIYNEVLLSKTDGEINEMISSFLQKEKENELNRIKLEKEEAQRMLRERQAAEAAEEAKKREIIERQRMLNEERKKRETEQKEKIKQVKQLFGDDALTDSDSSDGWVITEPSENRVPETSFVEISGKRLIFNTVFKVELCLCRPVDDAVIAYFTDESGLCISNRKTITKVAPKEKTTLGFVLNGGMNYASMKKCYLQFESKNDVLEKVDFSVNIAFSPDDF